jgi:hypothetical protein
VGAWLVARLTGDATLSAQVGNRWHSDVAPQSDADPTYPVGIYSIQAATDNRAAFGVRQMTQVVVNVKLVGVAGYSALKAAADRLDTLLTVTTPQAVSDAGSNYTLAYCIRRRPYRMTLPPDADGVRYYTVGALYDVAIYPA